MMEPTHYEFMVTSIRKVSHERDSESGQQKEMEGEGKKPYSDLTRRILYETFYFLTA